MKILVAYDGSDGAKRALDQAAELAHNGASVSVVSVAEPLPQFGRAAPMLVPEADEERKRELREAKAALAGKGIDASIVERKGDAATMIIGEAEHENAEVIVMGTRGLNTAQGWLLGSASSKVVERAPCNVMIVR
jgi:nucleotide-binding universal stress UspA family protein